MSLSKSSKYFLNVYRFSSRFAKFRNSNLQNGLKINRNFNKLESIRFLSGLEAERSSNSKETDKSLSLISVLEGRFSEPLTEKKSILLLYNCGKTAYDKTLEQRRKLLDNLWKKFHENNVELAPSIYNVYLRVCIENERAVDYGQFLNEMKCKPNRETYNLLLQSVCERGDIDNAVRILSLMKDEEVPADENAFNSLLLGHIVNGGLEAGQPVLRTMKLAHVPESLNTHWSIIKALAKRKDVNDFVRALKEAPKLPFDERKFCEIMDILGANDNHQWFNEFLKKIGEESIPRQSTQKLENVCISLIYCGKAEAAIAFYIKLIHPKPLDLYGKPILGEMVQSKLFPIETVISIAKQLLPFNEYALFETARMALKFGDLNDCIKIFNELDFLRPHFFWPLIISAGKEREELGVIDVLKCMNEMGVKPDFQTLESYAFLFCDTTDVDALMIRLQQIDTLKTKDLVAPLVLNLLKRKCVTEAKDLCVKHDVALTAEILLKPLVDAWCNTKQSIEIVMILAKICETNSAGSDWTGVFLKTVLKQCKVSSDYEQFAQLLQIVGKHQLKISSLSVEYLEHSLQHDAKNCRNKIEIENGIDKLLDVSKNDPAHILHPRDMNLEELENHLIELTNKGMETRGVLRKLIQLHNQNNNFSRVEELRASMKAKKYTESPGVKASSMNTYVQSGKTDLAVDLYADLKSNHPRFKVDSFKVLNLATLLVQNGRFDEAMKILHGEASPKRSETGNIDKNCFKLLNAAKTPQETNALFDILIKKQYCVANNIMVGPLVRIHLKLKDLPSAVKVYKKCVEQYHCTPLQVELLSALIDVKNNVLLDEVLNATASVHGGQATRMGFMAAMAEKGLEKPLTKFLSEMGSVNREDLTRRCIRWVNDEQLLPLMTLVKAGHRLSTTVIDLSVIHLSVVKIYSKNNDCEGALAYWKELEDMDLRDVGEDFTRELLALLRRCKYSVPKSLKTD